MNNLGTIVLTLINGEEKTLEIPKDMGLEIQQKIAIKMKY